VIQDFESSVDKFDIYVHGIFVESIIKVLSKFFVLRLPVGRVLKIVLEERGFEDVFWFDGIHGVVARLWVHIIKL
jgi:hypothetical protein